ncbi:MAG: hypothetical protein WBG50_21765 [Desulfomonilaceae bacterium]
MLRRIPYTLRISIHLPDRNSKPDPPSFKDALEGGCMKSEFIF